MFYKRIFMILVIVVGMVMGFAGCKDTKESPVLLEEEGPSTGSNDDIMEEIVDSKKAREEEKGVASPISGLYTQEESIIKRRPIAVMLDNQRQARPQAGLDQAEIIYEILAEGWITRYMAVFLINEPELIGPVRSARPYFIDKAMEFNGLYVHDGGSPQAFSDIVKFKVADIDAQSRSSKVFWRKSHKSRPHNEYTSAQAIRAAAKQSNYKEIGDFETLLFHDEDQKINGIKTTYIKILYHKDYKPSFEYHEEENLYYRYINGQPHRDEVSEKHLAAKNIIVQKAKTKVIDSAGRREIGLVGEGEGYFITYGAMKEIIWKKPSRRAITRFYDKNGEEITLNPGVTWIEVIPSNLEITTVE
ncbi:DUF3048 domain-containing protein [Clostridiaceae bacterium 35-E11]